MLIEVKLCVFTHGFINERSGAHGCLLELLHVPGLSCQVRRLLNVVNTMLVSHTHIRVSPLVDQVLPQAGEYVALVR